MSNRFKRLPNPLLATFVALLLFVGAPLAALAQSANLTILHVNDVYQISPQRGAGGLAELSTLLNKERARAENHVTTLGGDLLSPSVMSGLTQGAQMITLMNAIGLDLAGFGNHEFDFGNDVLTQRIADSKFQWLATNTLGADGKPFVGAVATTIRDVGEFKVGFFALLTPETATLSSLKGGVTIKPALETAREAVAALREQGANFVVAITHLDIAEDRAIARSVRGLDIILGGHEHDPIMFFEGGTLILKAGTDAQYLAVADVELLKTESRGRVRYSIRPQWKLISTAGVEPDPDIALIVQKFEADLDAELDVVIGTTETELDSQRSNVRTRETSMGNLIADAIRAGVGADVSLSNGGGIRGDRIYDAGTKLTRKDILTELPFGNVTLLIELTGADLLAALENGVSRVEDTSGRFPQVSGMSYAFDPKLAAGARISDVKVGGANLDLARVYTVATNDFIHAGGDGYASLARGKVIIDASAATLMATMVMDYIEKLGAVSPEVEGRITIK
ncbi:MAG: 5'-nucleotidase C-terminal domain-containing protein [Proteobacteria bacterium]|nr:5'-nucleotidase C-terminal domain-containing protein [Pseudomonadota bacterium]